MILNELLVSDRAPEVALKEAFRRRFDKVGFVSRRGSLIDLLLGFWGLGDVLESPEIMAWVGLLMLKEANGITTSKI
ncbi:hypothetical protein [Ralstonia pseudosolanacearum]